MTRALHRLRQGSRRAGAVCLALAALALLAALPAGCGTESPSPAPPPPTPFTVGQPATETVAAHESFFGQFVATSSAHTLTLSALRSNYGWSLFGDPSYTASALIYRCDAYADARDESCQPPLLVVGRTYYLRIDEEDGMAGSFTLTIS